MITSSEELMNECLKLRRINKEQREEEIESINKFLERLKGYGCGYHKQLEKQMLNRIKKLKRSLH